MVSKRWHTLDIAWGAEWVVLCLSELPLRTHGNWTHDSGDDPPCQIPGIGKFGHNHSSRVLSPAERGRVLWFVLLFFTHNQPQDVCWRICESIGWTNFHYKKSSETDPKTGGCPSWTDSRLDLHASASNLPMVHMHSKQVLIEGKPCKGTR